MDYKLDELEIKQLIEKYLDGLENEVYDEGYATDRVFAKIELYKFLSWLKIVGGLENGKV